jgi:hypothetical protein
VVSLDRVASVDVMTVVVARWDGIILWGWR